MADKEEAVEIVHPLMVRVTHWVNAFSLIVMMLSGWRIYNAAPIFAFEFPAGFTLGGWLAGALAWHFAAMWLLVGNAAIYFLYLALSGHFRRAFLPISPRNALREIAQMRVLFAGHAPGHYNAAQRLIYVGVFIAIVVVIFSGAAIWKPVQFQELTALMGGYDMARRIHFFAMSAIALFLVVHVSLALTVQGVLTSMFTGRSERRA